MEAVPIAVVANTAGGTSMGRLTPIDAGPNDINEDRTMPTLKALFPSRRQSSQEATLLRRALKIWEETGNVPVVHMVAELDWTTEFPAAG